MRKLSTIFVAGSFLVALAACGKISPKGEIEMKEFKISDFFEVDAKGKFRVFWVNSPRNVVEVETFPNFIKNLDIDTQDGVLKIFEDREVEGQNFYSVTVYSPHYPNKLTISDSIEFNVSGELKAKNLKINIKDQAKFIGSINSEKADIQMEKGALANFKGFTKNATLSIKDSSNIIAPYWMLNVLNIHSKNGAYSEMNVKDSIKGEIKDQSKFIYYGNPVSAFKIDKDTKVHQETLN